MSAAPDFEIFIPPSPSTFLPRQDNAPPHLPWESHNFVMQSPQDPSITICIPRRGLNALVPQSPWPMNHTRHYSHNAFGAQIQPHPPPPPSLQINAQLSINVGQPENPDLIWDIIYPPQHYALLRDRTFYFKRLIKPGLGEPAFMPSVDKAWILSDHPVLAFWIDRWGPMVIKSDDFTVEVILNGIYEYLRTHLTRADLSSINSIPGNRQALRYARSQRAKDSHEIESVVVSQGYRRVDVVGGHRQFQGLHFVFLPDRTWRLRLSLLPGTIPKPS